MVTAYPTIALSLDFLINSVVFGIIVPVFGFLIRNAYHEIKELLLDMRRDVTENGKDLESFKLAMMERVSRIEEHVKTRGR